MEQAFGMAGTVSVYGLPDWIGGIVSGLGKVPIAVRALLDGALVGMAHEFGPSRDAPDQLSFHLVFDRPLPYGAVRSGALRLAVTYGDDAWDELTVWSVLAGVDAVAADLNDLQACKAQLGPDFSPVVARFLQVMPGLADLFAQGPRPILTPLADNYDSGALAAHGTTAVHFPVGLASAAGDAFLGRDGHAFLHSGSNDLAEQYRRGADDPAVRRLAAEWTALIRDRRQRADRLGVDFLQVIIPEKHAILAEYIPDDFGINGPSSLLRIVDEDLRGEDFYLSGLALLRGMDRGTTFRKLDTHLTPLAACRIAEAILSRRDAHPVEVSFDEVAYPHADLGDRFFDVRAVDAVKVAGGAQLAGFTRAKTVEEIPDVMKHTGRRQSWSSPAAPLKQTVLVVGNSFFNFADAGQHYISFWMSHWVEHYCFIWSPSVDWEQVRDIKPDLLICQTIERFLPSVPAQ